MRKAQKQKGGDRKQAKVDRLEIALDLHPVEDPSCADEMPENSQFPEIESTIHLWIIQAWGKCQSQSHPGGPRPVGRLRLELLLTKMPQDPVSEEWRMLEMEITDRVVPIFLGTDCQPQSIDLPFVQGTLTFQPLSGLDAAATAVEESLASRQEKEDNKTIEEVKLPRHEDILLSPEETIQKVIADLIPTLPPEAEEKAKSIIALERTFSHTLHAALLSEAKPLIKSLLENIPAEYEGKRSRATLINALLTALDIGIQIQDQHHRSHVCSMHPVRGRGADAQGYLRLIERVASGPSRKSFSIPPLDQLQIIETSHPRRDGQEDPHHNPQSI